MKILFLDDEFLRHHNFNENFADKDYAQLQQHGYVVLEDQYNETVYHCGNSAAAIAVLSKEPIDFVSLDHDLGGPDTGMEVVDYLCAHSDEFPALVAQVHSANIIRAPEMRMRLRDAGFQLA